jgi:hypothetical protein
VNGHTKLFRFLLDVALAGVGIFMLLFETLHTGRWPVMMVALVLVGLVPAMRLDELLRR